MSGPVVFLDFDGVIVTRRSLIAWEKVMRESGEHLDDGHMLDSECVRHLDALCEASGAEIVISSSWRRIHELPKLASWLRRAGVRAEVIGRTQMTNHDRGHEIALWLMVHQPDGCPYVVLDDDTDAGFGHGDRFVRCDLKDGLTDERAAMALSVLQARG